MKNKSKLKKQHTDSKPQTAKKPVKKAVPSVPAEWLYLTDKEITARDIAEALADTDILVELWEEAGVAEVVLDEQYSLDVEWTEPDLGDEVSNAFLEQHQTKSLFFVTVPPERFELAQKCMKKIMERNGGLFCGDTEDFMPTVTADII